jgi:hypothetical protein
MKALFLLPFVLFSATPSHASTSCEVGGGFNGNSWWISVNGLTVSGSLDQISQIAKNLDDAGVCKF